MPIRFVRPPCPKSMTFLCVSPEVVATSHPMYNPGQFGLPGDAVVLVSNDVIML